MPYPADKVIWPLNNWGQLPVGLYSTGQKKPDRERVTGKLGNAKWNAQGMLRERKGNAKGS